MRNGRLSFFRRVLAVSWVVLTACASAGAQGTLERLDDLVPLHQKKIAPGPYDWMAVHPEQGQTFQDFVRSAPVRPSAGKDKIYIVLLGDFDDTRAALVREAADYMRVYFGLPVEFADPLSLDGIPDKARRVHPLTKDPQILSGYVIDSILKPRLPAGGFCLIAFTASDLWPGEGWNFVFGQASIEDRVGVWSMYRNGDPFKSEEERQLCLRRTIATGTHEIGHLLGMHHCPFYECNMNGSNYREEADRRPLWLCPVCLKKLLWSTGADPVERYRRLADVAGTLNMPAEKEFFERSGRTIEK